ncbi:MAG: glycosyltransferase family 4 protein [Phycisphaerae bacterium]
MSIVLINNSAETFTPTVSGAIATFLWECCSVARAAETAPGEGAEAALPWVITRSCTARPYDYPRTIFLDYPRVSEGKVATLVWRAQRKLNGWRHLRQEAYAQRVAAAIQEYELEGLPLVLHNDPEMAIYLRCRFPDATIVHHFHNHLDCKPKFRTLLAHTPLVLTAVSRFTADWVEHYYGLPAGSVRVIYNGVDAARFSPAVQEPAGPCILNFVGRTGREKGPDLLLKAALKLARRTQEFGVQVVGANHWGRLEMDDYQRELQALVHELGTHGIQVNSLGHVARAQMPEAIRAAHIQVVPARWDEPFGLTTVEGMACGLATVASRTGGTPEIIGDSGLLFERDSADDLAAQLEPLLQDRGLRRRYALLARQRALDFSWQRTWAGLLAVAMSQSQALRIPEAV